MYKLLLALFLCFCTLAYADIICGPYKIANDEIDFTDNEKIFICGAKADGWKKIPKNQALNNITTFLGSRGYFEPEIKENKIFPGKRSYIKSVEFKGEPPGFLELVYVDPIGKVLNENSLNKIENWAQSRMESIGYPCSKITIGASYKSEKVEVLIEPGEKVFITAIEREEIEELDVTMFRRYDAIKVGDSYNADFFQLTSRRMINSGIVSYSYFNHSCADPKRAVKQKIIVNKPNQIILGFGASTEEFPIFKANWRNTRLNENGSSLQTLLYLSSVEKSIEVNSKLFMVKEIPAFSIKPYVLFEKLTERIYEVESKTLGTEFQYTADVGDYGTSFKITPSFVSENQIEGEAPGESDFFSTRFSYNIRSHYYEYFLNTPKKGHEFDISLENYNGKNKNDQSLAGQILKLSGTQLFNISNLDPPSIILGIRFHYSTLLNEKLEQIPQKYRLYLGGEKDIRGFSRKSINNDEKGFKTTAHIAIETRFNSLLPYNLQPLLFVDLAKVGIEAHSFSKSLLYSPGVGMRWQSPFGSFRTTLARGLVSHNQDDIKEQTTLFLSYGKEF